MTCYKTAWALWLLWAGGTAALCVASFALGAVFARQDEEERDL